MGERLKGYSDRMGATGWGVAAVAGVLFCAAAFEASDTRVESIFKDVAGAVVDEIPYMDNPFEKDVNIPLADSGKFSIGDYYGQYVTYTNVDVERIAKVFGLTTDTLKVERDGYLVNRLNIPGYLELDRSTTEVGKVYVTANRNGEDVGIDVTGSRFEMLRPDTAQDVGGILKCNAEVGDINFTGCIPGVDTNDNTLSRIPIFGANSDWAAEDIANNIFSEYGRVDDICYWDNWVIPALNEAYARARANYGIDMKIDGPLQYDQAAKTLIRYHIRSRLSPGVAPSDISIHLTGEYRPLIPLTDRLELMLGKMGVANEINDLNEEMSYTFCTETSDSYQGDVMQPFGFSDTVTWDEIAIMGMEQVPNSYDALNDKISDKGED